MSSIQFVYLYVLTIPFFLLLDGLWLGLVAKKFYAEKLGYLFGPVQWSPVVVFYLLYTIGALVFAVAPALKESSFVTAVLLGSFLGFIAYATYDLTNFATVRDWPVIVVVVDILWGTVVTGSVAAISYGIARSLFF